MPIAAALYALLVAVCTLTSGPPSILSNSLVTPDSSTTTTVIGTDSLRAWATAASIISLDASLESVGRIILAATFADIWSDLLGVGVVHETPMIGLQRRNVQGLQGTRSPAATELRRTWRSSRSPAARACLPRVPRAATGRRSPALRRGSRAQGPPAPPAPGAAVRGRCERHRPRGARPP